MKIVLGNEYDEVATFGEWQITRTITTPVRRAVIAWWWSMMVIEIDMIYMDGNTDIMVLMKMFSEWCLMMICMVNALVEW